MQFIQNVNKLPSEWLHLNYSRFQEQIFVSDKWMTLIWLVSNLIIVTYDTNDDYTLEAEQKQQGERKLKELGKKRAKTKRERGWRDKTVLRS